MTAKISVEVAYALPDKQLILKVEVPTGTTALEAVLQSGIADHFPGLDVKQSKLGVFGEIVRADSLLQAHDRVEIYRPLQADPKEARRKRVSQTAAPKKGGRKLPPQVSVRTR
ncbi:RnfH family protein [Methylobacillus arboreus]|uniref:RnfH family protein n=1 Tax=Methylobacillus arboreus TaxID=755170 RepID=UPI001E320F8F|nr:RnfH family protein [Methylobacillus arboreus]MCB5191844.1 RnfH family protein [Methylobacillus arboreus]